MTDYTLINGVDKLYYALIAQDDAGGYAAGTPKPLSPIKLATATPATAQKTEYYDNQPMFPLSAEGETKIKIEIAHLPLDDEAELLGKVYDAVNDSIYDGEATPPYLALGYRAMNHDGTYTMFWYYKGTFVPFEEAASSKTNTPDPKNLTLEFTAVQTIHEFSIASGVTKPQKRRKSRKQADLATWFDTVQVPEYSAPSALTCTPSPADGATNQTTTVAITLTFNNPLTADAERGIGLLRSDTMAAISVTRSLNAARTVVTLAHSALTAEETYLISVNGVRDVYGQSLADVVYDFTVAAA
jgi:phi13 family phage major tail protein